jgi:uncharacterized protein YjiS (DUF1127 family)
MAEKPCFVASREGNHFGLPQSNMGVLQMVAIQTSQKTSYYSSPFRELRTLMTRWAALGRQRKALSRLDSRLLADIGLGEEAAARECDRPFWRV